MMVDAGKAAIAEFAAAAVASGDVPGVVVMIVNRDGVLCEVAAGQQDVAQGVPMAADTLFRIASMTKPITSVAIMMLVEAGEVKLDDPVAKYLPEDAGRQVFARFNAADATFTTRPAARPITLRHLLTHTSGIGYAFCDATVNRIVELTGQDEWTLPLLHDPGERWTYGASTRIAGWVVEKVSGQPLDVFLRTRIFEPLDMRDTGHVVPPAEVARVVTVHRRVDGVLTESPNDPEQASVIRGDGGLYSTARDYTQFLRMLLNGGTLNGRTILAAKTVQMMRQHPPGDIIMQTQPAADPARTRPFPIGAGRDRFGLGFQITAPDPRYIGYRSPGSLGWCGINNTHFWIDLERQIAVVVLMQVLPFYDEACIRVLRGIEQTVYRHLQ